MLLDDSLLPKSKVDPRLMERCLGVIDIPDKDLGRDETTRLWAQDRIRSGDCARRHNALVDSVKVLEK